MIMELTFSIGQGQEGQFNIMLMFTDPSTIHIDEKPVYNNLRLGPSSVLYEKEKELSIFCMALIDTKLTRNPNSI